MKRGEIRTTGQLREVLANAVVDLLNGDLDIDNATTLHKLAKSIHESLYSETKIAIFANEIGQDYARIGELVLGDPRDKAK